MDNPQRPGLQDGVRTEFTIMAQVKPGHEQEVRETIERGQRDPSRVATAKALGTLHEARWVIFDQGRQVLFASSFDGTWDRYIDDFGSPAAKTSTRSWRTVRAIQASRTPPSGSGSSRIRCKRVRLAAPIPMPPSKRS
jgi:hypothetical protein